MTVENAAEVHIFFADYEEHDRPGRSNFQCVCQIVPGIVPDIAPSQVVSACGHIIARQAVAGQVGNAESVIAGGQSACNMLLSRGPP